MAAFGIDSGVTLAAVVAALIEVPVMTLLVKVAQGWRGRAEDEVAQPS